MRYLHKCDNDGITIYNFHMASSEFISNYGSDYWNNYYSFSIIRHPIEVLISVYYHNKYRRDTHNRIIFSSFSEFIRSDVGKKQTNKRLLEPPKDHKGFDKIMRFENLQSDFNKVIKDINLIQYKSLPNVHTNERKDKRPWYKQIDYQDFEFIIKNFKEELDFFRENFGYEYKYEDIQRKKFVWNPIKE